LKEPKEHSFLCCQSLMEADQKK